MADANQQAQELADMMERVNREMALYGKMHQSTANDLQDATMKAKYGFNNFTKGTETAAGALTSVAKAGMEGAKAMYEGKKGAAAFNGAIDELSNAAKLAGAALTLLVPGGPIIKLFIAGITAAATATAEYVKKANEMADKIYDGYSKLAKAGGAASDGMTGVYQGAKKLGLSMNELDSYVGLIADNAGDLTLFAGSVAEGRKQFENMGAAMEPYRKGLLAAGYTQQEINDASMQYLRLQSRIGQSQNLTTKELAEGAKKYLTEQDALTKLTGMNRKEQEQALEAARSQQRFRAKLEEMRNSGDAQQIKAADDMETTYKMLYKRSKEAAAGYGDLATGMLGTDAAMKLYQSTQGEALTILDKQKAGQIDSIKAFEQTGKAVGRVTKEMNYLYQMGVGEDTMLKINEGAELGIAANKDLSKEYEKIREDQKKQGMEGGAAADKITDQYAENVKKQQELNKKLEDDVFKGISNAMDVTKKLGQVTEKLTGVFTALTDAANGLLNILGIGKGPSKEETKAVKSQDDKNWESASAVEKAQSSVARGMEKFARGLGRVTGITPLERLADSAQAKRVESESAYLKKEGKFQAAPGTSTAGGGRGSVNPPTPGAAAPAAPAGGGGAAPAPAGGGAAPTGAAPAKPQSKGIEGGSEEAKPNVDKLLSFTERSGSKSAFEGLDQTFKDAVIRAAEEYNAITGKTIQINSAKRDPKDQERIYAETVEAGRPGIGPTGMKVAKPGRSLHEQGHAVDIQQYKDPVAVAAFNKQGLSQKVPNDPVHFQAKEGGVFDGPDSGYNNIIMHGQEAIIPLKNGAVPVQLTGESGPPPSALTSMLEMVKAAALDSAPTEKLNLPLFDDMVKSAKAAWDSAPAASLSTPSFAEVTSADLDLNLEEMRSQMLSVMQDMSTNTKQQVAPELPEGLASSSSIQDLTSILQESASRASELVGLMNELLRAQKDQNDISTRLLQVAAN